MPEKLLCVLFLVTVILAGYGLIWLLDRRHITDAPERMAGAFPTGLAAVGAILYTLNVLGLPFAGPLVMSVLGCGLVLGLIAIFSDRNDWVASLKRYSRNPLRPGLGGTICLIAAGCIILGFTARSLSEVNHLQDTELYHLPYAAIVFRTHHQPLFASQSMSEEFSFPPALFVVYAALWTCLGHINQLVPNVLPLPIFLSWTLLTLLAARRIFHCSDGAAAFALLLLAGTYELEVMAAGESADFLPLALAGAALYWVARDVGEGGQRRIILAASLLGLNCWVKYHGIPFAACLAAALFLTNVVRGDSQVVLPGRKENRHRIDGRHIARKESDYVPRLLSAITAPALLFVGAVLVVTPFLIRNLVMFGSPIYPGSLGPFHGVYSSAWSVQVVGGYWQPKMFYHFPDLLGRCLREPAILMGVPALALAYRRQHRPAIFLLWSSLLFLVVFLATMNSDFPSALRFTGPALGALAWLGGWVAVELEGADARTAVKVLGCFWALTGAAVLTAPFTRFLWTGAGWSGGILNYGWILLFVVGLTALAFLNEGGKVPGIIGYWIALVIGAVTLLHHQPFPDFRDLRENFQRVNWAVTTPPSEVVGWMAANLDPRAVTYTYYAGRWPVPGALFPGDDPFTEPIHQPGVSMPAVIEILRKLGVQYVLDWRGIPLDNYPAYRSDAVIHHLDDTRYFKLLQKDNISTLYQVIYPAGEEPMRPTASDPMPWLLDFAASGPHAHGSAK